MLFIPVLSVISMATGLVRGYIATYFIPSITPSDFEMGLQTFFEARNIFYSIIKSLVYAFIISSGASYFGYTVKGGALGVGRASTNAVVSSCVLILLADVVLTSLLFM